MTFTLTLKRSEVSGHAGAIHTASGGWWFTLFTAILGAVILLWVLRLVRPRNRV